MKRIIFSMLIALCHCAAANAEQAVKLSIDPAKVLNRVDERIYGHFLEHIFHSVNGGLWGELIWNRSFEHNSAGKWTFDDGQIIQHSLATNQRLTFGDEDWRDYELTLEAKKTGGEEGFLILFRVKNGEEFYWANIAGWGNSRSQIQRGQKSRGWDPVGPSVAGGVEKDKWYKIRIRCEGRHFQVFMDGKKLIDFTDGKNAHLRGKVGVGTWKTKARFRNVKVVSPDGKTLLDGAPASAVRSGVGRHWEAFGYGEVFLEKGEAANCDYYLRIKSDGDRTGLVQGPMDIHKGETYVGSLWVRGEAPDGLAVRLLGGDEGDEIIARAELEAPTDKWARRKFTLKPDADAPNAKIQIAPAGKADVRIDQVSMMPKSWKENGGFRPDLLNAIKDLSPPVIRWPGGCFASAYRWKRGIGPQHQRRHHPHVIWDDLDVYSFGTDEFVEMCRRVGAEPIIVVNVGSRKWNPRARDNDFLAEALDWLQYCNGPADSKWGRVRAANGHPEPYNVKYWEIDNETWHMGAKDYAEAVNRFAPALRKMDGDIEIIACGSGGYNNKWNREVIRIAGENFDYISTHHYEKPDNFATGPPRDQKYYHELQKIIAAGPNPDIKVYCSEWNAQSTDWRTGLYCGGILNVFERCGEFFEIGGPALFLRHVSAARWDNAFINFDHRTWFPAPNYVVMKLWREHYAPHRIALAGDDGPLNVVASKSADGRTLYCKLVNPSKEDVTVQITPAEGFNVSEASMKLIAPADLSARNSLEKPHAIKPVDAKVARDGRTLSVEMPAISCGVVTIQATKGGD